MLHESAPEKIVRRPALAPLSGPDQVAGGTAREFATANTFTYACHIHPGMRGTVVVGTTAAASTSGGSADR